MKNTKTNPNRNSKHSSLSGNPLHIKIIETKKDVALFTKLAKQFHYMGEGCPAGDTPRMAVVADGEWIGWTDQQRAARQKLIIQNRRFVLLAQPGKHPNQTSRILGKVAREPPSLWRDTFGYEPLLAETFSDIEAREGTCYKASGWTALGKTKGVFPPRGGLLCAQRPPQKAMGSRAAQRRDRAASLDPSPR